jgi:YD repeat-containing protein
VPLTTSTTYNGRGQVAQIGYGNGLFTSYFYTPERGFLSRVATYATGGALDVTYTRDLKGRITVADSSVNTEDWQYYYDDLGRLTASDNLGDNTQDRWFAYDLADNMTWNSGLCALNPNMYYPTSGPGPRHAPNNICGWAPTYDANGNTTWYDVDGPGPMPAGRSTSCMTRWPMAGGSGS